MAHTVPPPTGTPSDGARIPIELLPLSATARPALQGSDSATGVEIYFAQPRRSRPAFPPLISTVLVLLGGVALFAWSARADFLLGQLAAPVLTIGALHGLWRGGFRKIIMLAAAVGVLYGVVAGAGPAGDFLQSQTSLSNPAWAWLLIGLAAVLALVLISVLVKSFRRRFIMKHRLVRGSDRLLGMLVGTVEAALVILTVCWMVVEVRPYAQLVRDRQEAEIGSYRHVMAARIARLADEAGAGQLGKFVSATNPINDLPQLRQLIDELNTKGQISLDSLGNLDPETIRKLNELLRQAGAEDQGGIEKLIETHKPGNATGDRSDSKPPR